MKTTDDRAELQMALEDSSATLLLLFGDSQLVGAIHAKAETIGLDPDWKFFWVANPEVLTPDEKKNWYRDESQYATLSMPGDGEKRNVKIGPLAGLCLPSGEPSALALRKAFTAADS